MGIQSMEFSRQEYWSGWLFPSPGDLPNPGIKSRSPTLQADSLPAELQGQSILDLNLTIKYDIGCTYCVDVLYCVEDVFFHS